MLFERINDEIKEAMKAKNEAKKRTLRAIKSAFLLVQTDGTNTKIDEVKEIEILTKLAKQRKESIDIYTKQNREDLAATEIEELDVINSYLPQQLSEEEIAANVREIISKVGAKSVADMGKVMGMANKAMVGKAEGSTVAQIVKKILSEL